MPVSLGVDLIAAFYGCLYCGCVPVTVRPPHPQNLGTTLPTVKMIVEVRSPSWQAMPVLGGGKLCMVPAGGEGLASLTAYSGSCFCVIQVSKSACVLSTQAITRLLKSKEAAAAVDVRTWPTILDTGVCRSSRHC